jgi:hypothetical protein
MSESCGNCRYWIEGTDPFKPLVKKNGQCRRYPPKITIYKGVMEGDWPFCFASNWCGEHAPNGGGKK